jgi:bla regulator protein BlaR1
LLKALILSSVVAAAWGQTATSFEVASIKASPPEMLSSGFRLVGGGRLEGSHVTVRDMVAFAYDVRDFSVTGGPGWASTDRFEILAKAEADATKPQMREMLKLLLADRFKLAIRHETKQATLYRLVVAKGSPGIQRSSATSGFLKFVSRGHIEGEAIPMSGLAAYLQTLLGQVVQDQTGLAANYDFKLLWTPDEAQAGKPGTQGLAAGNPDDESAASIFTALQEQLGLKLESSKGPVDNLTIEHVEKPSEN